MRLPSLIRAPAGGPGRGTRIVPLLLALLLVPPARGENYLRLEAEGYYEPTGEIPGCGPPLVRHECNAASGGWGVDGVDCAGEWIPLELLLPAPYTFQIGTRSAASVGFVRRFDVRFLNPDDGYAEVAADTLVTDPGLGFS